MIQAIKKNFSNKSILLKCITASLFLHLMVVYLFYKHPIEIYATSFFSKSKPLPTSIFSDEELSLNEKDSALEEAFENFIFLANNQSAPFDERDIDIRFNKTSPQQEEKNNTIVKEGTINSVKIEQPELSQSDFFSSYTEQDIVMTDQSKADISNEIAEHKQINIAPKIEEKPLSFSSEISYIEESQYEDSYEELNTHLLTKKNPVLQKTDDLETQQNELELPKITNSSELLYIPNKTPEWVQNDLSFTDQEEVNTPIEDNSAKSLNITTKNSPLDEDKLFKMTNIVSWNESFDINVKISSPSDDSGYVFSISIDPKQNMAYEKIPQNFYFLIDSSHTVDRHKFSLYKRAVTKALSSLREGDRFNIVVLDKKLSRLSNKTIVYNIRSQQLAEDFIDKVSHNNIITSANLLDSLEKVSSFIQDNDEMHTAILLTTGQVNQSLKNQQKGFKTFIEKNSNKFSLYAAAVGNKNNLVNLDMLCNLSGGKLLYSDTNASFPRKLASMIKSLRFPIAKDVKVTAVATNSKARLNLVSNQNHLPPFYANETYTIIGNIERLCDIHLTIEAKHDDEWVCIQKTISFNDAIVDEKLVKQWNKAIVTAEYESFLKDPKGKHIKKAKEILQDTYGRSALE